VLISGSEIPRLLTAGHIALQVDADITGIAANTCGGR
jgi:hypothetical protein